MATEKDLKSGGLIDADVEKIVATKNTDKDNIEYEVILHTEKLDMKIEQLTHIEVMRDYNSNVGDFVIVKFNLAAGTYTKQIYPYRDNLELTVIKRWKDNKKPTITTKYKYVIYNVGNAKEGTVDTKSKEEELNASKLETIEGQCVLREIEGLRSIYVDGIYKNVQIKDVIQGMFGQAASQIEIEGNALDIQVDVVTPANDYDYQQLIIPTGITLMDLPSFLQTTDYGVYNGAIGTYVQMYNKKHTVFVYPLYSKDRYNNTTYPKLTIFNVGSNKYDMVENTYKENDGNIEMIAGSNVESTDSGATSLLSGGDGIISTSASSVLNRNFNVDDTGITFDNTQQLSSSTIVERRDGQVKGRYVANDSNMYRQRSVTIRNTMAQYHIPWQFSCPDYIYPGMPCCYVYEDAKSGLVKLTGTVQGIFTRYDFSNKIHQSILLISVMSPNVYYSG